MLPQRPSEEIREVISASSPPPLLLTLLAMSCLLANTAAAAATALGTADTAHSTTPRAIPTLSGDKQGAERVGCMHGLAGL